MLSSYMKKAKTAFQILSAIQQAPPTKISPILTIAKTSSTIAKSTVTIPKNLIIFLLGIASYQS